MKNQTRFLLLTFVLFIIIIGCKHSPSIERNVTTDTLLTKTISFPNSLLKLDGTQFQKIDSFISETENKTKIISIIDGNCMKCIVNQLNHVDSIFNSIMYDSDNLLIFILIVSKDDSAFFMRNLQPAINAAGAILWDNNYNFERENKLFTTDANLRTFMLNNENRIIQYGNPLMNPNVIFEYQEKLEVNSL